MMLQGMPLQLLRHAEIVARNLRGIGERHNERQTAAEGLPVAAGGTHDPLPHVVARKGSVEAQ